MVDKYKLRQNTRDLNCVLKIAAKHYGFLPASFYVTFFLTESVHDIG